MFVYNVKVVKHMHLFPISVHNQALKFSIIVKILESEILLTSMRHNLCRNFKYHLIKVILLRKSYGFKTRHYVRYTINIRFF